ncbi:MAG: phosphotyrosine protein phosphatase [Burkholderiales bacterium]|nr:phosphotyrosine protein phosphatase [Burkholderiales bacterium]
MQRLLFICTQNRLRSPTAEQVFVTWPEVETDSAGLGNDAEVPLSSEQIEWASTIFVMEKVHLRKLKQKFKRYINGKKIICLDIPDDYDYMQPELVQLLLRKVSGFLPAR